MSVGARLWAAVVPGAALALLPLSPLAAGSLHGWAAPITALLLAVSTAVAHRRPVHIGPARTVGVGTIPEVAATLLLPGPLAAATLVSGALASAARRRAPPTSWVFHVALAIVRAVLGGLAYTTARHALPAPFGAAPAALVAAAVMSLATTGLTSADTAGPQPGHPRGRAVLPPRDLLQSEAALALTGVIVALAAMQDVWALPLAAAPAAIAWRALRDGAALRVQTRAALEELADIVDLRDHYTAEHCRRTAELARLTAERLALPSAEVELIALAARVHDVGKIGIKSSILMKPGPLSDPEWREMRTHPEIGARLLARFPEFTRGCAIVRHHHERYDGSGYPDGLAGDAIPLGARILAVVDAWDAMTSHRAYRPALDSAQARARLLRGRGTQFDPAVVDAFLALLDERPHLVTDAARGRQGVDAPRATAGRTAALSKRPGRAAPVTRPGAAPLIARRPPPSTAP